ncbi:NfeD family protein [Coprobacter tertius]|uniref:Nodulation protein NfeD n=1 Tax=Coprobacter tertius TaxID=2944915 RepID=A0ABT1MEJ3_9BACT|nr:NfeD family protein [Coprobacter tertius]MCP9611044.1 nodulation protein NfeD [Coprobacter tertius]
MKRFPFLFIFFLYSVVFGTNAAEKPLIYKIDIKKEIGSTTWRYMQKGNDEAVKHGADAILLHLNTYGGTVVHADSIRTLILNSKIPVYAFIDNNAASAGALIAIACDSIYMRPGANIGAVTVVNETGAAMPDKYQSYMRATIRSTAEAHGADTTITSKGDTVIHWRRDPRIAEAMVDERVVIPNVVDSGKVLTLTAQEAVKLGYCEGIVNSVDEIATKHLGYKDYRIEQYKPSVYDEIAGFLSNPALQAILIMIIIGGIYFELQSPGLGFPSAAAIIAAILYFAPLYMSGMAESWEILIFVAGIILLVLELLVIPGFGVAGILGSIFIFTGLILALVNNVNFDFSPVASQDISRSILTVVSGIICGFALTLYLAHKIGSKGIFRRLALQSSQEVKEGYIGVPERLFEMVGKEGVAATILRPAGKVTIGDDDYDAVALYGYIERGEPVKVVKTENSQLYVVKK